MKRLLPTLALLGLAACGFPKTVSAPPPAVSEAQAAWAASQWPGATPESLAAGRDVFAKKCNGCHGYPDLNAKTDDTWPQTMARMAGKADLNTKQHDDTLHFILAAKHDDRVAELPQRDAGFAAADGGGAE